MPRQRIHDAAAVHAEDSGPLTERSQESATYGTHREHPGVTPGASRESRRGKCRPKRCTVRKTLKLTPLHAAWLDELASAANTTGCAYLKSLLIGAYVQSRGRK